MPMNCDARLAWSLRFQVNALTRLGAYADGVRNTGRIHAPSKAAGNFCRCIAYRLCGVGMPVSGKSILVVQCRDHDDGLAFVIEGRRAEGIHAGYRLALGPCDAMLAQLCRCL